MSRGGQKKRRKEKRMSESQFNPSGGAGSLEIPTARFNVGVIFNAEVMGRRTHLFQNVPNTELSKLLFDIRTVGVPLIPNEDGKHELVVIPSGIAAIEVAMIPDEVAEIVSE